MKVKLSKIVFLAVVITVAGNVVTNAVAQVANTPFYTGIAYERLDVNIPNAGSGVKFDSLILRGGYRFSDYFGAEAEIGTGFKSDTVRIGNSDVKFESGLSLGVYGVGFLPLSDRFDLIGRLGYKKATVKAKSGATNAKASDSGFAWSVGGQYYLTGNSGIRIDYQQASGGDVKVITAGYQFRF